jgi:ribosomal protein S13
MSEFAFFRFVSYNKNEIIELTEQVLDAKGIECDSRIAKISEEQLKEILEEVRQRRKKKRSNSLESDQNIEEGILVQ